MAYDYYYTYDAAGNRTSWQVVGGSTTTYTYNAANKMISPGTFTYDDKGNPTEKVAGANTTTYTWDYMNRMTQWTSTGQTTMDFVYNGDGMRVRKTPSGGTATNFLLGGREIVEEITGSNVTSYVGPGLISKIIDTTRTVYHADGIGSTRAMTDSDQAVTMACVYDAYGNLLAEYPSSSAQSFGYAGQDRYYADSTGLDYLKARYYDPAVGRFLSRDPIGYEGGLNLYSYVGNIPTVATDPAGLHNPYEGYEEDYEKCKKEALEYWAKCQLGVSMGGGAYDAAVCAVLCIPAALLGGAAAYKACLAGCAVLSGLAQCIDANSCLKVYKAMRDSCEETYERSKKRYHYYGGPD